MEDGVGSNLWNILKTPLGIIHGGRSLKNIFSARNDSSDETESLLKEEIINILEDEEDEGKITTFEKDMISGVLNLFETKAKEVMIPRTSVFTVNIDDDITENIDKIIEERYSRVPVYEKDIDNIIGVIHIKDLFAQMRKGNLDLINLRGLMREPFFVNEHKNIDEILVEMKKIRTHMAVVIDEYGGFSGIITIEDLMEEIVGDISDEDDEEETQVPIQEISPGVYRVDGFTSISELNELLDINLPTDSNETVGGLLLRELGMLPNLEQNDEASTQFDNVELKGIKVNEKRIETLLLKVKPKGLLEI